MDIILGCAKINKEQNMILQITCTLCVYRSSSDYVFERQNLWNSINGLIYIYMYVRIMHFIIIPFRGVIEIECPASTKLKNGRIKNNE